jgi:hypothetical protein
VDDARGRIEAADRRRGTGEEMFSVHDGEPPFVGKDDADAFERPVETACAPNMKALLHRPSR